MARKDRIEPSPPPSVSKVEGKIWKEKPRVLPPTSGASETKWEEFEKAEIHFSSPFPPADGETITTALSIQNCNSTNCARLAAVRIDSSQPKGKIWKKKPGVLPQTSGTSEIKSEKIEKAEIHVSSPFPPADAAPQSVRIGETTTTVLSIENGSSTNCARLAAVRIDSSQPKGKTWKEKPEVFPQTSGTSETESEKCEKGEIHVSSPFPPADGASQSVRIEETITTAWAIQNGSFTNCARSAAVRVDSSQPKGKIQKEKPEVLPQTTSETKSEKFEKAEIHVSSPFSPADGAPQSVGIGETITTASAIQNGSSTDCARLTAVRVDSSQPKGKIWREKQQVLPQTSGTSETKSEKFEKAEIRVSSPFPPADGAPQSVRIGETITTSLAIQNESFTNCARSAAVRVDSSQPKGKIQKDKPEVLPQTSGISETKSEEFEKAEIHVSYPFPLADGAPQSARMGETITTALTIQNGSSTYCSRLVAVRIDSSNPKGSFTLCYRGTSSSSYSTLARQSEVISFPGNTGLMEPGRQIMLDLSFIPKRLGLSKVTIVVDIGEKEIVRNATLLVCMPQQKQDYDYPVPDHLKEIFRMKRTPEILLKGLSEETYCEYFSTLLYLEDIHLKEMSEQSVKVKMRKDKESHLLVVLKLQGSWQKNSGGRLPSTLDYVHVKDPHKKGKEYKGCINKVDKKKVFVRFEKRINVNADIEYEARFSYNRSNIIRGHHAIAKIKDLSNSFLFPFESPSRTVQASTDHGETDIDLNIPFNPLLNSDQISAVMGILKCNGSPPYLVYGKPHTGTTAAITEAILQIHEKNPNARILACTPFNRTSDSLLKRFIGSPFQDVEVFRLNAKFRDLYDEVPPEIYPYCCYDEEEEIYYCPPLEDLREYRLIVSTCMSAARLQASGLQAGHFTHIFIDTAGLCSEPETMVAIANFATEQTVVVVSGNLGELAHQISCPMSRKFGLSKSYLKRLTELPFYSFGFGRGGKPSVVTKLEEGFNDPHSVEDRRKSKTARGVWKPWMWKPWMWEEFLYHDSV